MSRSPIRVTMRRTEEKNTRIKVLYESGLTPAEIGHKIGLNSNHVRNVVKWLRRTDQIELLTDEQKQERMNRWTEFLRDAVDESINDFAAEYFNTHTAEDRPTIPNIAERMGFTAPTGYKYVKILVARGYLDEEWCPTEKGLVKYIKYEEEEDGEE